MSKNFSFASPVILYDVQDNFILANKKKTVTNNMNMYIVCYIEITKALSEPFKGVDVFKTSALHY